MQAAIFLISFDLPPNLLLTADIKNGQICFSVQSAKCKPLWLGGMIVGQVGGVNKSVPFFWHWNGEKWDVAIQALPEVPLPAAYPPGGN